MKISSADTTHCLLYTWTYGYTLHTHVLLAEKIKPRNRQKESPSHSSRLCLLRSRNECAEKDSAPIRPLKNRRKKARIRALDFEISKKKPCPLSLSRPEFSFIVRKINPTREQRRRAPPAQKKRPRCSTCSGRYTYITSSKVNKWILPRRRWCSLSSSSSSRNSLAEIPDNETERQRFLALAKGRAASAVVTMRARAEKALSPLGSAGWDWFPGLPRALISDSERKEFDQRVPPPPPRIYVYTYTQQQPFDHSISLDSISASGARARAGTIGSSDLSRAPAPSELFHPSVIRTMTRHSSGARRERERRATMTRSADTKDSTSRVVSKWKLIYL